MAEPTQKAIFFDLMGTCCDWLSSLLPLLQSCPTHPSLKPKDAKVRELAAAWREGFFEEIHARFDRQKPIEDIDITNRRVLDRLLKERDIDFETWDESIRNKLVHQWHVQKPWPDVIPALNVLRAQQNWFLVVLANGTTRLQHDIVQSSDIPFHSLLSSELLGLTKPDPAIYRKAIELVQLPAEKCVMLASHLYDLKAAKDVGMQTIYVHRTTEDPGLEKIDLQGEHNYVDLCFDERKQAGCEASGFLAAAAHLIQNAL
jgi:2-haloalkanoic acid dehalogenase type II